VGGIFLFKDLVVAEDADCFVLPRPDAQLAAAFWTGGNDIRNGNDLYSIGFIGFLS